MMDEINIFLAGDGANYRVVMAEYITAAESGEMGATILQKDVGNKQLGFDFVPFDPNRTWSGPVDGLNDNITYAIDQTGDAVPPSGGLSAAETDAAIVRGMQSWENVLCSELQLTRNPDFGLDIGVVAYIASSGVIGSPYVLADVQHAGWRDLDFAFTDRRNDNN